MAKIHKFYYEVLTLREWYLMSWPKTCVDCAKESDVAKCPGCGNTKPIEEETVTDTVVVKELEKFDRKITARIEKNLDERDK